MSTIDTSLTLAFHERIVARANREARVYLNGLENGNRTARELKAIIESIVATDYDGRTVVSSSRTGTTRIHRSATMVR